MFDDNFQKISSIVQKHAVTGNRSLFQCFVDDLRYPYQIRKAKNKLQSLESPQELKKQFGLFTSQVEIFSQTAFNSMLNQHLARIFIKDYSRVKTLPKLTTLQDSSVTKKYRSLDQIIKRIREKGGNDLDTLDEN